MRREVTARRAICKEVEDEGVVWDESASIPCWKCQQVYSLRRTPGFQLARTPSPSPQAHAPSGVRGCVLLISHARSSTRAHPLCFSGRDFSPHRRAAANRSRAALAAAHRLAARRVADRIHSAARRAERDPRSKPGRRHSRLGTKARARAHRAGGRRRGGAAGDDGSAVGGVPADRGGQGSPVPAAARRPLRRRRLRARPQGEPAASRVRHPSSRRALH